jgi:hypothetical protein
MTDDVTLVGTIYKNQNNRCPHCLTAINCNVIRIDIGSDIEGH